MKDFYDSENLHKEIFYVIDKKGVSSPKRHGEFKTYKIKDYTFKTDTWSKSIDVYVGKEKPKKRVWLGSCWGGYERQVSELILRYYYLIITKQEIPYMYFDKEEEYL